MQVGTACYVLGTVLKQWSLIDPNNVMAGVQIYYVSDLAFACSVCVVV